LKFKEVFFTRFKMENFVPTKQHLREVLLHYFFLKKSAAESCRLLSETYGEHSPSIKTCEYWFRRFKTNDFDVSDKERSGAPKKNSDAELEALLDEDPCQTQTELAIALNVTQPAISQRLHSMGMVQKEGNWVPYELRERDLERRKTICEILLQRQKRKGFLHRIITGDEKWIYYDNPKRLKAWVKPGEPGPSTPKRNIHGSKVMLCIWWDQKGVIYYELLQPSETITGDRYRTQLMRLKRALTQKRPEWENRHNKVILQHDNARPHVARPVKNYLEGSDWEVLPHPPYSPDIAPSDYHLFRSMQPALSGERFTSYEGIKNWLDNWIASKEPDFFLRGIRLLPERWEKVVGSDGAYFE
jgi:[histone H3]-lysine36 N-dimethyltransferase SETMAR